MSKERARCTNFIVQGRRNRGVGGAFAPLHILLNPISKPITVLTISTRGEDFNYLPRPPDFQTFLRPCIRCNSIPELFPYRFTQGPWELGSLLELTLGYLSKV